MRVLTLVAFLPPSPFGNPEQLIHEWLMAPITFLPIQMFNWISRPEEASQANAAAAGLVLLLMTLSINGNVACGLHVRGENHRKVIDEEVEEESHAPAS